MRKPSKEAQQRQWAALEQLVDERDAIAMEVMQQVFARLPYGEKFTLSDGSVAHLEKLSAPELCPNEGSHYYQRPQFSVDVAIEGGKLDHIEISAFQTGSGMALGPAIADAAEAPKHLGKWTASHGRPASRDSASTPPRKTPERGKGGQSLKRYASNHRRRASVGLTWVYPCKRPTSPNDHGRFFLCVRAAGIPVVSVAPPGSRLVFFQNREAEHPALGGQSESVRGELRELHAARAGEVDISFAGDEEIPPNVHDQGLAVSGVSPGVVPRPGESVIANDEVSDQGSGQKESGCGCSGGCRTFSSPRNQNRTRCACRNSDEAGDFPSRRRSKPSTRDRPAPRPIKRTYVRFGPNPRP